MATKTLEERLSLLRAHCADTSTTSNILLDILATLRSLDESALRSCLASCLSAVFSVWSRIDEECGDLCAKAVRQMFVKCGIRFVLNNVSASIFSELKDGPPSLKELLLELIIAGFEDNPMVISELSPPLFNCLLSAVAPCMADEESSIGGKAQKLLVFIARSPRSLSTIFEDNATVQLFHSMIGNDNASLRVRLYDLICSLVAVSEELLDLCIKGGFMDAMLNDLGSNDLLVQLNVIELLTDLILLSPSSMQFFYAKNVLPILHSQLMEAQTNPDGGLQHVALVKFFGSFLGRYPKECIEAYPDILRLIYSYIRYYDSLPIGLRLLAFDTIALAASTSEGKRILANQGEPMKEAMECLGKAVTNGPLEIRVRHLEALEKIFTVEEASQLDEFSEIVLNWFNSIYGHRTLQQLFDLTKRPFESHQAAMYRVLRALASFHWFPEKITEVEGFFDFLVSRMELAAEVQHIKFELMQRLASNPGVKTAFNTAQQLKLREYIRHGALYCKAVPQLATE